MSYLTALFLGLVQGVAEFLPISSSGHLSVLQNLFKLTDLENGHLFFDVLLHVGTLGAVLAVYRRDVAALLREFGHMTRLTKTPRGVRPNVPLRRMIVMLALGTLPLLAVLPLQKYVAGLYNNTFFIGFAFLVTGLLLFTSDRFGRGYKTERNATLLDAVLVGVGQALAVIPGLSRSGTTVSAGLGRRFDRSFAVRFSFLLSIPAVLGATILSLVDAVRAGIDTALLPKYLVGMVAAAVSGYLAINLLHYIAGRGKFGIFAYYCWGAGLVTLILSLVK